MNNYIGRDFNKGEVKSIERKHLKCKKIAKKDDQIGYSITQKKIMMCNEIPRSKHTVIVGASGFGKSALMDDLILADLDNKKPVILIDPKGDQGSLTQFVSLCRIANREVAVFSEHYTGMGACNLNPVKMGSATNITDRIHASFTWSEPHYEELCYDGLFQAVDYLIENKEKVCFESILSRLLIISDSSIKEEFKFKRDDISGIISRLSKVIRSDFGKRLVDSGFSMHDIWTGKKCLYVGLPVLGYPKIAKSLGKLILGDLAHAVYHEYKSNGVNKKYDPVGIYIDELSAVITDEFVDILNKCRGANMELTFAFQSVADITKVSPELLEQILENSSTWFILKQRMESGAKVFAESIGTIQTKKHTNRVKDGQTQDMGSERVVEAMVAHNNIIKNLNVGQCILLRHAPTRVDLLNIKYIDPYVVQKNVEFLIHYELRPKIIPSYLEIKKEEVNNENQTESKEKTIVFDANEAN